MTYSIQNLNMISSGKNKGCCTCWSYSTSTDTLVNVSADGYFNDDRNKLLINDLIYINASDGATFYYVTALSPNVTLHAVIESPELVTPQGPVIIAGAGAPTAAKPLGSLYIRTDPTHKKERLYIAKDNVGTWTYIESGP